MNIVRSINNEEKNISSKSLDFFHMGWDFRWIGKPSEKKNLARFSNSSRAERALKNIRMSLDIQLIVNTDIDSCLD